MGNDAVPAGAVEEQGMSGNAENGWELSVERRIAAPTEKVWRIMTERLAEWWCPKPWRTIVNEIEWRAGGVFDVEMRGPNPGEESPSRGMILEFTPGRRLVFTDAFTPGWTPNEAGFMVGGFEIAPDPADAKSTLYRAWSRHWDEASMKQHAEMGFHEGWGAVAEQLAALAEG